MAYEFKLPDLGEGLTEGEIARWLVAEGQEIAEDDPLVEVQTDKTTVEIPSPAAGKVARILVAEGEVVPVGTVLVVIGEDGAAPATWSSRARKRLRRRRRQRRASPRPRCGRRRSCAGSRRSSASTSARSRAAGPAGASRRTTSRAAGGGAESQEGRREPLRGVRRLIAEHMARAHREVPPVTWVEECDFTDVDMGKLVALTLKAVADALAEVPELNARLEGNEIVYLDRCDLGVAVQTEQGLVVPVVREMPHALGGRARDRGRPPRRSRACRRAQAGGAARLDLHGHQRGKARRPLPDSDRQLPGGGHPQYRPHRRAACCPRRRGRVRQIGYVSVTFDHRVVDGARAAQFGLAVIRRLEGA